MLKTWSIRTPHAGRETPTIKGNGHHTHMHTHYLGSATGTCPWQRYTKPSAAFPGIMANTRLRRNVTHLHIHTQHIPHIPQKVYPPSPHEHTPATSRQTQAASGIPHFPQSRNGRGRQTTPRNPHVPTNRNSSHKPTPEITTPRILTSQHATTKHARVDSKHKRPHTKRANRGYGARDT